MFWTVMHLYALYGVLHVIFITWRNANNSDTDIRCNSNDIKIKKCTQCENVAFVRFLLLHIGIKSFFII